MYSSISVFLVFALVASAMGGQMQEKYEAAKAKCIAETGIDSSLVKDPQTMPSLADDKCFSRCMIKEHAGEFKADGSVDLAKLIANIPTDMPEREGMVAALTACADMKGANECETGHMVVMCFHEKKKSH